MARHHMLGWTITVVVVVKAAVMTLVATLLDVGFFRALILVAASAIASGSFGLVIAILQIRENRRLHDRIEQLQKPVVAIARHTGTDRREGDPDPEDPC